MSLACLKGKLQADSLCWGNAELDFTTAVCGGRRQHRNAYVLYSPNEMGTRIGLDQASPSEHQQQCRLSSDELKGSLRKGDWPWLYCSSLHIAELGTEKRVTESHR